MKLLLTSAGLCTPDISRAFVEALGKKPEEASVLMLHYAQNPEEEGYVVQCKKELMDLGIERIKDFNLKNQEFYGEVLEDVVYVCGGNTFAILKRMKECGVFDAILRAAQERDLVYVGVSAGSIIAGPDIGIAGWGSEGDKNEVGLEDMKGLGFTDVMVYPHYHPGVKGELERMKETAPDTKEITNEQALLILPTGTRKIG